MFGYLFPTKEVLTIAERKIFRNYFCTLCLAHRYRYGRFSSLLNNFDMGVFAIVLNLYGDNIEDCERCGKKVENKRKKFTEKKWGNIVDYNINLMRKKIDDDIKDNSNIRTMASYLSAKGIFSKCQRNNRELYDVFDDEFNKFQVIESKKPKMDDILNAYETFARNTLAVLGVAKSEQLDLFASLNRWIYWIDAIDDYDQDIKNGTYNPYVSYNRATNKALFIQNNIFALVNDYETQRQTIIKKYSLCSYPQNSCIIIENIINHSIRNTTKLILENKSIPKRRKLL